MEVLNLEQTTAESVVYSEDGVKIEPGEVFFVGEIHGHKANFTLDQGENFLGFRDFTTDKRKKLASKGHAMKDGSYPIENCKDAANAIRAQGRGGGPKPGVVAHIKKRVKALGCSGSIFEKYK